MATSSIFRNVILKSSEDATSFLEALERSQLDKSTPEKVDVRYIEHEDTLNAFLDRMVKANV
jgi:hypothetical protein